MLRLTAVLLALMLAGCTDSNASNQVGTNPEEVDGNVEPAGREDQGDNSTDDSPPPPMAAPPTSPSTTQLDGGYTAGVGSGQQDLGWVGFATSTQGELTIDAPYLLVEMTSDQTGTGMDLYIDTPSETLRVDGENPRIVIVQPEPGTWRFNGGANGVSAAAEWHIYVTTWDQALDDYSAIA